MTTINSISRQPTQQDYASPSQFKFSIAKLPKVEFFCTEVNIPGISLGNATQLTTLRRTRSSKKSISNPKRKSFLFLT